MLVFEPFFLHIVNSVYSGIEQTENIFCTRQYSALCKFYSVLMDSKELENLNELNRLPSYTESGLQRVYRISVCDYIIFL